MIELKDGNQLVETTSGFQVFSHFREVSFILWDATYSTIVLTADFYHNFLCYLLENITEANEKSVMEVIKKIDKQFWEGSLCGK